MRIGGRRSEDEMKKREVIFAQILRILLIGVFFMLITAQAGAQGEDEITSADLALLEFLGDWGTEEGEWIDPLLFDDEAPGGERPVADGSVEEGHREGLEMNQEEAQNPFEEEEAK